MKKFMKKYIPPDIWDIFKVGNISWKLLLLNLWKIY
jgi:hypothetical protein